MPENESFITRFKCPLCGEKLVRDPGFTGIGTRRGLKDDTTLCCPKCQPTLQADDIERVAWPQRSW